MKTRFREVKPSFSLNNKGLHTRISGMEPRSAGNSIPLTWAKAKDFSVWDGEGNKFIDMTSGIFVANAGHSNPKIKQAIKKQVDDDLLFAYNYPTVIKEKFERKLISLAPKYFNAIALLNSGSEAMHLIFKILKLYGTKHKKKYIIAFNGSYHGRGLSSDLIAGNSKNAKWSRLADVDVVFLDFPYDERAVFDPSVLPPPEEIAGFILETFQGWGAWMYPKPFVTALAAFAKKHKALLCFDEMQAGFYRMSPLFGYMTYGDIQPDMLALGKGISSSLPLSAVLSRKELLNIEEDAVHYGTQSGNAVVLAAALANIEFLSSAKQKEHRKKIIPLFEKEAKSLERYSVISTVNVRGLVAGLIFKTAEDATAVLHECIKRGVLPVCTNRNSIKLGPPLTISSEALKEAFAVIGAVLAERSV
jgi:acetylornithine/succinyldiaminopimelate/putrescine aminotransferase